MLVTIIILKNPRLLISNITDFPILYVKEKGAGVVMARGKKKTHEQFIKELHEINADIEVMGTYKNSTTKIKVRCLKDGYIWEVTPKSLLKGHGCPKCAGVARRTHEEFINELTQINPNIEVLGTYKTHKTKIRCRCKIDEYEWEPTPDRLLRGVGCPKCYGNIKKTHKEFIHQLQQINDDIEVLGTYKNGHTKISCRCKVCGHEWKPTPSSLLQGRGCPKCGKLSVAQQLAKTHKQFIQELYKINPDIEVLGTYVNTHTKIKCKCRIDGYEWEVIPKSLLRGRGCPKCKGRKLSEQKTKTHEQFLQQLHEVNPSIEVLDTYVNSQTKILCKCKIDGYQWQVTPSDLLSGYGCPKCAGNIKKTHQQFIQELKQINPDIQVLGTYVNNRTKIKVKCKIDGYEWETIPVSLLRCSGCPKCGGKMKKTHEEFIKELQQINPDIEILGTYVNNNTKIKCKCKIDGYIWETRPSDLLKGHGCSECKKRKLTEQLTKTHEQFIHELHQVNKDIEVLGTYENAKTKIKCRCKICGNEWEARPNDLLNGVGCPKCNISKGEKRVAQYLDNLDINYIYNTGYFNDLVSVNGRLLRPDFIIPGLKIWIEFDGQQHFAPTDFTGHKSEQEVQEQFKQVQQNDQIKNQYAKDHNWTLIRIPYWDYDNIEQILDNYIKEQEQAI